LHLPALFSVNYLCGVSKYILILELKIGINDVHLVDLFLKQLVEEHTVVMLKVHVKETSRTQVTKIQGFWK
jgi:hypothetical protein